MLYTSREWILIISCLKLCALQTETVTGFFLFSHVCLGSMGFGKMDHLTNLDNYPKNKYSTIILRTPNKIKTMMRFAVIR